MTDTFVSDQIRNLYVKHWDENATRALNALLSKDPAKYIEVITHTITAPEVAKTLLCNLPDLNSNSK